MEKLYIVCSAVKYKDHIIHGRRHGDAFQTLEFLLGPEKYKEIKGIDLVPGFIDQYGEFYTRTEAWQIADAANQIKYGRGTQEAEDRVYINFVDENGETQNWRYKGAPQLISEHLYPEKD
jgi:hypothetical protein